MEKTRWYKDKVFYQIWPRSFKDGDGDGMGDLWGVADKLDYLKELGMDGIWFSPIYPSPGADCGYDIADYMDIDAQFGGMEAFKKVLDGAHERGMKVIMDLVVNHTSDEHEWFQKSRQRIEPYTDYYIWRPAKPDGKLPNNWDSMFEGKAWTWDEVRQEYYLHVFAVKQPDLNMDNPLVREEVKKVLKFWLDMGVDGFREDVITFISKKEGLPDDHLMPAAKGLNLYNHGPHIHEYLHEFKRDVLDHYDCVTLAEAPMVSPEVALSYIEEGDDQQIDMMIQFETQCADCLFTDYVPLPFSLHRLKYAFGSWQKKLRGKAWNMLYLENHDHPRIISRYGSEKFWKESGKTLAASYLFLQGTPFIYQGQEIGMINWKPQSIEQYRDVQTIYNYNTKYAKKTHEQRMAIEYRSSRDNARTPVQWDDSPNAGFTTAKAPWMDVNENYHDINVAQQLADPDSILNFYKKAIALRKSLKSVRYGEYKEHFPLSPTLWCYTRELKCEKLLVLCSYSDKPQDLKIPKGCDITKGELILQNYENPIHGILMPYECRVYLFK